jgi:hypothetical protein
MQYQAAERSLMFMNSDLFKKIIKSNMNIGYQLVVRGLLNAN